MTQLLTTRHDKDAAINTIEEILERHIIVGVKPTDRAKVREHIAWLRHQPGALRVNAKFETLPHLKSTRIHLELAFEPIPGFETKESQEA